MSAARIYLAAGGTGGHIFPALAVAEALNAKGMKPACLPTSVAPISLQVLPICRFAFM